MIIICTVIKPELT